MIEPALRKFCESPHRKLIVIAGTFIVGLVLIMPLVDLLRAGRDEKEGLLAELDSARNVAAEMKDLETQVAEKLTQAKGFEARAVDDESMPALRGKLVDLAKETGCSIRRLNVGATAARAWKPGESPFAQTQDKRPSDTQTGPSFQLEWRPVSISLTGTGASLRSMVERVASSGMLLHTKSLEMYPSSPTRQNLTLDMELWYYTLSRKG